MTKIKLPQLTRKSDLILIYYEQCRNAEELIKINIDILRIIITYTHQ